MYRLVLYLSPYTHTHTHTQKKTTHTHTHTHTHTIVNYYRYVADILLIFDSSHTNIQAILTDSNTIHPNLQFTAATEQNNTVIYLDISIQKTAHNIRKAIDRKPTFIYTIIPYSSNHPTKHKCAAIRYLYNILYTYQLHKEEYNRGEKNRNVNEIS
jgi:hypothetical protein